MIWTDPSGLDWEIIDWQIKAGKRKRVTLGDWSAEGRAFVPYNREGQVLLFDFGRIAYRDAADRTLRDQHAHAKPVHLDPARRYWSK